MRAGNENGEWGAPTLTILFPLNGIVSPNQSNACQSVNAREKITAVRSVRTAIGSCVSANGRAYGVNVNSNGSDQRLTKDAIIAGHVPPTSLGDR